jgi:hypothetical protein
MRLRWLLWSLLAVAACSLLLSVYSSIGLSDHIIDQLVSDSISAMMAPELEGGSACTMNMSVYLWNLTNPEGFQFQGEAPQMEDIGPFALTCHRQVFYSDKIFDKNDGLPIVRTVAKRYFDIDKDASCARCTAEAVFYQPNFAFAQAQQLAFRHLGRGKVNDIL